ncbi:MAG: carboxymuconolactone decarboxylase family protein [Acidimicrobiales bacterium]
MNPNAWTVTPPHDPRAVHAVDVHDHLVRLFGEIWGLADPELLELSRLRMAQLLGDQSEMARRPHGVPEPAPAKLEHLSSWPTTSLFDESERLLLSLTEQFIVDVSGIDPSSVHAVAASSDANVGGLVTALFLLDYGMRSQMVLKRLFPASPVLAITAVTASSGGSARLGDDLNGLLRATARLDELDAVTSELVRLRGARIHSCRICKSIRSVAALEAGADEALFERIDDYEQGDLSELHKVALRLTDAMVTRPADITDSLAEQVRSHFSPRQAVELVADVMRNSCQKVAVALGADAAHVEGGTELFSLEDGEVVFLGASPAR